MRTAEVPVDPTARLLPPQPPRSILSCLSLSTPPPPPSDEMHLPTSLSSLSFCQLFFHSSASHHLSKLPRFPLPHLQPPSTSFFHRSTGLASTPPTVPYHPLSSTIRGPCSSLLPSRLDPLSTSLSSPPPSATSLVDKLLALPSVNDLRRASSGALSQRRLPGAVCLHPGARGLLTPSIRRHAFASSTFLHHVPYCVSPFF